LLLQAGGRKVLSADSSTTTMHGTWIAESSFSMSDRKLKMDINSMADQDGANATAPSWLLRQLRPVSYRFRKHGEAKDSNPQRYGFLADEVQRVLPDLVKTFSGDGDHKTLQAVSYQDLIALIVASQQKIQKQVEDLHSQIEKLQLHVEEQHSRGTSYAEAQAKAHAEAKTEDLRAQRQMEEDTLRSEMHKEVEKLRVLLQTQDEKLRSEDEKLRSEDEKLRSEFSSRVARLETRVRLTSRLRATGSPRRGLSSSPTGCAACSNNGEQAGLKPAQVMPTERHLEDRIASIEESLRKPSASGSKDAHWGREDDRLERFVERVLLSIAADRSTLPSTAP